VRFLRLFILSGDKASGPNGFSLGFFFSNMLGGSFFFYKLKYIKKVQRDATQSTQEVYKGKPKRGERSDKENLRN
jgi:hypothetical protein